MERISIEQASKDLGMTPQFIRKAMKEGRLPIGKAIKGTERCSYFVYREMLDKYLASKE